MDLPISLEGQYAYVDLNWTERNNISLFKEIYLTIQHKYCAVGESNQFDGQTILPAADVPKMSAKWKQFWVMEFVVKRRSNKRGKFKA